MKKIRCKLGFHKFRTVYTWRVCGVSPKGYFLQWFDELEHELTKAGVPIGTYPVFYKECVFCGHVKQQMIDALWPSTAFMYPRKPGL